MFERMVRFMNKDTPKARAYVPEISGDTLEERVISALRTVYDPEIPVNIYDLGLIYDLRIDAQGAAQISMTLTAPACPVAEALPRHVEETVKRVPEVTSARVTLVWDPPWTQERMNDEARLELGML